MFRNIYWILGVVFYFVAAGSVAAQGPVEPEHSDPVWQATYWNNPTLAGRPTLRRTEPRLDHDWGRGSPASTINVDRFSARCTRYISVTPDTYRFTVTADDGVRLWVDDVIVVDQWRDQPPTTYHADVYLGAGYHLLRVEYYENTGVAVARVSWKKAVQPTGAWRGEYYNNTSLSGDPALVRDDAAVDFYWRDGSPAPGRVDADRYSVRWSRSLDLAPGSYRFTLTTDDGARLYVNGHLLIDAWKDQPATTYVGDIFLPGGSVTVQVEYYENAGWATARLSWRAAGGSRPTAPVGYVTARRLNVRSGPGLSYTVKGLVYRQQSLMLMGRNSTSRWLKVTAPSGLEGWVYAYYVRSNVPITDLPVLQ